MSLLFNRGQRILPRQADSSYTRADTTTSHSYITKYFSDPYGDVGGIPADFQVGDDDKDEDADKKKSEVVAKNPKIENKIVVDDEDEDVEPQVSGGAGSESEETEAKTGDVKENEDDDPEDKPWLVSRAATDGGGPPPPVRFVCGKSD